MGTLNIIQGFLKKTSKVTISIIVIIVFFLSYNQFLIDKNLDLLSLSLQEASAASTLEDVQGLAPLLQVATKNELAPKKLDSVSLASITYSKNVVDFGDNDYQLNGLKTALLQTVKLKTEKRGPVLNILDKVSVFTKNMTGGLTHPLAFLPKKRPEPTKEELDLFDQAQAYRKIGDLDKARDSYQFFVERYPFSSKAASAKLFLGSIYQDKGQFEMSESIYKQVIKEHYGDTEAVVASKLLKYAKDQRALFNKKEALAKKLQDAGLDPKKRQGLEYELGTICMQLNLYAEAHNYYKSAAAAEENRLAVKSMFNDAMVSKFQGNFDESSALMQHIMDTYPGIPLADAAKFQKADILYKQGKAQEAVELLLSMDKGSDLAPISLFVAADMLMHEADMEKAQAVIDQLTKQYPDSLFANMFMAPGPWRNAIVEACSVCTDRCIRYMTVETDEDLARNDGCYPMDHFHEYLCVVSQQWVNSIGREVIGKKGQIRTVLVADNDDQRRREIAQELASRGYNVLVARDSQEVVAIANNEKARLQLIVLDTKLFTGPESLQTLSELPKGVPTVMAKYDGETVPEDFEQAGAKGYILKDDPSKIFDEIQRVVPETVSLLEQKGRKPFRICIGRFTYIIYQFGCTFDEGAKAGDDIVEICCWCTFDMIPPNFLSIVPMQFRFIWNVCGTVEAHHGDFKVKLTDSTFNIWGLNFKAVSIGNRMLNTAEQKLRKKNIPYYVEHIWVDTESGDKLLKCQVKAHDALVERLRRCLKACYIQDVDLENLISNQGPPTEEQEKKMRQKILKICPEKEK